MNELDKLRPEVRCALGDLSYTAQVNHTGQQQVDAIRAELLRLADDNVRLLAANRDVVGHFGQMKGELAAIKVRTAASAAIPGGRLLEE